MHSCITNTAVKIHQDMTLNIDPCEHKFYVLFSSQIAVHHSLLHTLGQEKNENIQLYNLSISTNYDSL